MIYRSISESSITIDTQFIFDKRLSPEAKLVLLILLTHDDSYEFSFEKIVSESKLSKYKVDKGLKELKENKYLQYKQEHTAGRFGKVEWIIRENPNSNQKAKYEAPTYTEQPEIITAEQYNFEQFWNKYPKKVNHDAALREFMKIPDVNTIFPDIMRALDIQIKSKQWREEGGRYIPSPENYIKKSAWNNVIDNTLTEDEVFKHLEEMVNEINCRNI